MRRVLFAPAFDHEVEAIGVYIDERFGERVRRQFIHDLAEICETLASFPGLGVAAHGYETTSFGFVFRQNWIFFEYDDDEVHFLHIVDGRRNKPDVNI